MMELDPNIDPEDALTEVYKNLMNRAVGYMSMQNFHGMDLARAELFCNMASHLARAYHRPLWAAFARECARQTERFV